MTFNLISSSNFFFI